MGIKFTSNWKEVQPLPFNELQIEAILQSSKGTLGYIANSSHQDVVVTAGIHKGGRPSDPNPDMRWHITAQVPHQGTWHVILGGSAHNPKIIKLSKG